MVEVESRHCARLTVGMHIASLLIFSVTLFWKPVLWLPGAFHNVYQVNLLLITFTSIEQESSIATKKFPY